MTDPSSNTKSGIAETVSLLLLLFLGTAVRIWFWNATRLTLEDSLITLRYAENIAAGNGFVYNIGERVLGTTTPLWTLLLAGLKIVTGGELIATSKLLGIVLDAATLLITYRVLRPTGAAPALLFATLFATSPYVIPVSVSGMETPLLLFCMAVSLKGFSSRNSLFAIGLACVVLTRIDGLLFSGVLAVAALIRERKWALRQITIATALCAVWCVFALLYFGGPVPQSLLAKRVLYNFDVATSLAPFLHLFTPIGESSAFRFAVRLVLFLSLAGGLMLTVRRYRSFFPLAVFFAGYCVVFAASGTVIFQWYTIPALFASYILMAIGLAWGAERLQGLLRSAFAGRLLVPLLAVGFCLLNIFILGGRTEQLAQLQQSEDHLRKTIGLWLRDHASPGSEVLLEPIGYIGYYAGPAVKIRDEIGLVTPALLELRKNHDGWYIEALRTIRPEYVIQYAYAMENNIAEGTRSPLFADETERAWFERNYREEEVFDVTDRYPAIEPREKKFILYRRLGAPRVPLPTQTEQGDFAAVNLAPH